MKIRDYVKLLEHSPDEIGAEYLYSSIGAKGIALVCHFNRLNRSDMHLLPFSVQWGMMEKILAGDDYKREVMDRIDKIVDDFSESDLKDGVTTMLKGLPFALTVELDGTKYSLALTPSKNALNNLNEHIGDANLRTQALKASHFRRLMSLLEEVNGEPVMLAARPERIFGMRYIDALILVNVYDRLHQKLASMDWEDVLKNSSGEKTVQHVG